ncbi:DUF378 domain-containing protein [Xanthomonas oryzae]|uniref:DUF378 domain-containing protein n=1 Tax=Xanthomonas oryzae TaxID=347 RepID=UPI0012B6C85D|nr:DUF378 domain-containing protein [Xanthomonas oryzae]QGN64084.1 DUF378 domain-containing protein [Xanthomonas oryzae pv. oryzae]
MKAINVITLVLLIVGGLNWGLVGLFQVAALFGGQDALLSRVVYTLVGIWALWQLVTLLRNNHGVAEHHTSPHVRNNRTL